MNSTGINLASPAPLEDNLQKFNTLYIIFFIAGSVIGFFWDSPWYIMGAVFLIPAWIMKSLVATFLTSALQKTSFAMSLQKTGSELAGTITIPLTQLGMTVTVDGRDAVATYKSMEYHIRTCDDGTFGIIFDHTLGSRVFMGRRYITQYKKAIVAMGLIAYTVQNETGVSLEQEEKMERSSQT